MAGVALLAGGSVPNASAAPGHRDTDDTAVVSGLTYGPKDGLEVDTQQFVITPGEGPVGVTYGPEGDITPMQTWGSSYAISTETLQLWYDGKAKAAGNVYDGKRIIQACFWYSRGGSAVSSKKCSSAYEVGKGLWASGAEVTDRVMDDLNPVAPPTIFNVQTTRITP